ncbi:MAG: biopolymer transporter ExbD [Kiritimatiellaeota bacterium]|nr:biopolymer transporter ExbD [Kiritimatiellota bacterium]
MKIRRKEEVIDDGVINTSPLVDIMFILIIFFLVTMTFNENEHDIEVNLPETDLNLSSASKAIIINVRADGSYYLGSKRMRLSNIQMEMKRMLKRNPQQKVLVRGDKNALHGHVAAAVAACKASGIMDANIGYVSQTR